MAVMLAMIFFACTEELPVTGVKLDKTALTLTLEETAVLKATVEPANAAVQPVTWRAEPAGVVTLTDNKDGSCTVKAVKEGRATVTVTTADGGKTAQCRVFTASALVNLDLIAAVERATDGDPVNIGWKKEADGTVKLTAENLKAIRAVTALDIDGHELPQEEKLTDISGIEWFAGLTDLHCEGNRLTTLDVSANTALKILYCGGNSLTTLDVSSNTELVDLSCYNNQLTTLDVSANTKLLQLLVFENQLTTLDVSANTALEYLYCSDNQLTTLDVSDLSLTWVDCSNNQLMTLDTSGNTVRECLQCNGNRLTTLDVSARYLYCFDNQLTALDVSGCSELEILYCYDNQLTTLDVSKNTELRDLRCGNQNSDGTTARELTVTVTAEQKTKWDNEWGSFPENGNVTAVTK